MQNYFCKDLNHLHEYIFCRKVLANEMNDETLEFCTTYPNAFFVATDEINDDKVLGIIGCEEVTGTTFELTRLTVLPDARYQT